MKNFDVIVVGAGAAGSIAAYFGSKFGFDICLLDSKPTNKIGDKICGDGIGSSIFEFLNIPRPKKGEFINPIRGAKLYPPDINQSIKIKDNSQAGYVLDRLAFGQRLVNDAVDAGAQLIPQTHAISPIMKENQVIGVKIKSRSIDDSEIYANVVIDASGFHTQLRKQIDAPFLLKNIDSKDYIVCYREIVQTKNPIIKDLDFISIYLNRQRCPGGYIWYFPRNEYEVNIGFGVSYPYRHKLMEIFIKEVLTPFIGNEPYTKLSGGSGLVSVCKPLYNGVANGIMFVGDAAYQVNPITGGGLVAAMQAGYYAINAYKEANKTGTYDALGLWNYNLQYQKTIGAEFASLDLFRLAFQSFPNSVLDFAIKKELVTANDIMGITSSGELSLPIGSILGKIARGFTKPHILLELNYLRNQMQEMKSLYQRYPSSPFFLSSWVQKVEEVYKKVKKRFRLDENT